MAAGSLLALLDDIASILDDVSVLTKTAASKTAGVLGDDLALNAQQVSGVVAKRELPVVWGVAKGSFVNKLILVPLALLISAFAPWAVTPLLMVGGLYLCFEGCEKLVHKFLHRKKKTVEEARVELATLDASPESEKEKIKGTDVLVLNALRAKPHYSHLDLTEALALVAELGPREACFTHISHQMGLHAEVQLRLPPHVRLAWDGLQMELPDP